MAKTKTEKENNVVNINNTEVVEEVVQEQTIETPVTSESNNTSNQGPTYEELMRMVQTLANEVSALKNQQSQPVTQVVNTTNNDNSDVIGRLVETLANKKADKEVVIVHNCEILGGATTHIHLSTLDIDFHSAGEERVLSWQQFEELVSKYMGFFKRRIILLGAGQNELAQRYNVPMVENGTRMVTHDDLIRLGSYGTQELSDFMRALTPEDRELVAAFWAGKCFDRAKGYYDRAKVELINNMFPDHPFENIIVIMNADARNENLKETGANLTQITDRIIG